MYSRDTIPSNFNGGIIVNLDRNGEKGSHWISIVSEKGERPMLYDSFGEWSPQLFPNKYDDFGHYAKTDDDVEQSLISTACGQLALSFIIFYQRWGREAAKLI